MQADRWRFEADLVGQHRLQYAIQAVDEAQTSVSTAKERTRALVRAAELTKLRHEGGELTRLDVINAERAVLSAQADVAEERRSLAVAQSSLFRALGGGWQRSASERPFVRWQFISAVAAQGRSRSSNCLCRLTDQCDIADCRAPTAAKSAMSSRSGRTPVPP